MKIILKKVSLNKIYVIEICLYLRGKNKRLLLFIFETNENILEESITCFQKFSLKVNKKVLLLFLLNKSNQTLRKWFKNQDPAILRLEIASSCSGSSVESRHINYQASWYLPCLMPLHAWPISSINLTIEQQKLSHFN